MSELADGEANLVRYDAPGNQRQQQVSEADNRGATFVQYTLLAPSYINILNVYAGVTCLPTQFAMIHLSMTNVQ